jgi:hypothetical protein
MKNTLFWDVMPSGSYKNRRFGGTYCLHNLCENNQLATNNVINKYQLQMELLVTANVVPSLLILVTLTIEAIHSPETYDLTRATRRHIPNTAFFVVTAVKPQILHVKTCLGT